MHKEPLEKVIPELPAHIPRGVKLIAWARTIRYIGWGFGEALIPIFIFSFSHTFAEAGLFQSVLDIVGLMVLPIIGAWADRASARYLILVALLIYPFVGISYFLAGVTGGAIFIVLARAVNGFTWELEDMGVCTYYERVSPAGMIGKAFGFIDSWANLGWIAAALVGILLLPFIPVHVLLLAIAPFAIAAFFLVQRAKVDEVQAPKRTRAKASLIKSYTAAVKQCRSWNMHLWLLSALVIFEGIIGSLMWFFIPIDAYVSGAKPAMVVLLMIVATVPSLFGYIFGAFSDKGNKYLLLALGLFAIALIMGGMAIFPSYAIKLAASFLLGLLLEFFSVIQKSLVTMLGPAEFYGEREGAFASIATLGGLASPLVLGILLDIFGFSHAALALAAAAALFSVGYFFLKNQTPSC